MDKSDFVFPIRVRNWRGYHRALVWRGSITLWVEQVIAAWRNGQMLGRPGRLCICTNNAIECALIGKAVFHLSLPATQGFMESVVRPLGFKLPVPECTAVSRRQAGLKVMLPLAGRSTVRHVVIDTRGLALVSPAFSLGLARAPPRRHMVSHRLDGRLSLGRSAGTSLRGS